MAARRVEIPRILAAMVVLAAACAGAPAQAQTPVISVMLDRAVVLHVDQPADTVIIGNPAIADATVRDNQTLILTGRSFGTTNLIVLDKDGKAIVSHLVTVSVADDNLVTVYNRTARQTYSCTPVCEPVVAIGDDQATFGQRTGQIDGRNALIPGDD